MPSFNTFKKYNSGVHDGQVRKIQSDMIMDATWWEDISSREAYIYDYDHDDEPLVLRNLHPEKSKTKTKVDIKYLVNAYNSEAKDQVGYHIQFRPGHECPLDYYYSMFEDKYDAEYPVGLYIDIPDEQGIFRKWLICEPANQLNTQFPTWYILPCDHIFQWIFEGVKYQLAGVSRNQNSYNSGLWQDYKIESTQNQRKCTFPMNEISTTIYYNQRIIISAPIKEPIVWKCSKVEQTTPKGVNRLTFTQEEWDAHRDVFEYADGEITNVFDPNKKVYAMWAGYYDSNITPVDVIEEKSKQIPKIYSVISYSGLKPEIKSGGNYKTMTVRFYYEDGTEIAFRNGDWSFSIDGVDAISLLNTKPTSESNQISIKFKKNDMYIGKVLKIIFTSADNIQSYVELDILGL